MSFWAIPVVAPKNAVIAPTKTIKVRIAGAYSKIGEHLIIKNTPAVTIVAACNKAETGVGPSIASGNQVCNPIWADLPIAPINRNKEIKDRMCTLKCKVKNNKSIRQEKKNSDSNGTNKKTVAKSKVLK